MDWVRGGVIAFLLAVFLGCWVFAPRGYELNESGVRVCRVGPNVEFGWGEIESIEQTEGRVEWVKKGVRVSGVAGLFGWWGYFYRSETGGWRMYATRLDRLVVLRRRDAVPVVLSPDDPDGFIEAVRDHLPAGADRQKAA